MEKKIENFNPLNNLTSGVNSTLFGSYGFERFIKRNAITIILLMAIFFAILMSTSHTHTIYNEKIDAERRLKSIEAEYSKSKEAFRKATLNSFITDEVERRSLKIKQSNSPTVVIE